MFNPRRHPTHPLILLIFLLRIQASPGDYSPGYQRCVNECNFRQCYIVDSDPHQLPFSLRLFHWTCPDDCSYRCMHDLTEKVLKLPKAIAPPDQPFEDLSPSLSSRLAQTLESMATTTTTGTVPPYINSPIVPLVFLVGAGLLELLDFPPVLNMSLDAHALWHLSTIPLGWAWCVGVLGRDAKWESQFVEGILDDDSKGSDKVQEGASDENSESSDDGKLVS
ncbi:uncharacterized protein MELLADRAFT_103986 [Melampsora larici-populina 98AG31]|uniref:Post-GPI attachment to proteins factor 3 n=1 Tax=Melampsora larici-populina (strain 98AG31 / pathotype 3-4-7) TaxID=747676 RepID=F4RCB9_MELLP|nr:uncharacterized protein MELLADRAFT_103986 [Melampsora larici-populina 98AG31]EGG09860.1 hypothetical protein MELLADRAFT_103986 [Melampsora larici-populina 98AG31]